MLKWNISYSYFLCEAHHPLPGLRNTRQHSSAMPVGHYKELITKKKNKNIPLNIPQIGYLFTI